MLASVNQNVGMKRLAISLLTGRREAIEVPKSLHNIADIVPELHAAAISPSCWRTIPTT
jgi:hypothetical protein